MCLDRLQHGPQILKPAQNPPSTHKTVALDRRLSD